MRKTKTGRRQPKTKTRPPASRPTPGSAVHARIHPVIIYPFRQPEDYSDLEELYRWVEGLNAAKEQYARPITVMDRKTWMAMERNKRFQQFRQETVARHSELLDAWCVDTCQMWYAGLGAAFELGGPNDVYWLIPGDFNYGTPVGQEVLTRLLDLPEIILELDQDICIGEIATDPNDSKQLIDTYGTFALLYNWFPAEAQAIRQFTERPRSEFFAIRHPFLREVLQHRWYAYEQTVVMLLQAVFSNQRITRFFVGHISDLPSGQDSLGSAVQQVERTERVLKLLWQQRNQSRPGWTQQYRVLEAQSEQVLRTALIILENLLK